MEQGDVPLKTPPAPKKRSRSKTKKPAKTPAAAAVAALVANVVADKFVCNYTGRIINKGVQIAGCAGVFANLPVAFRWLEQVCGQDRITYESFVFDTCAVYEQTPANVPVALDRANLQDFGGNLSWDEYCAKFFYWNDFTERSGINVDAYQLQQKGKIARTGRGKQAVLHFDAGCTVIAYNKKAAGCVRVGEAPPVEEAEDEKVKSGSKKVITLENAFKKLDTFISTHKEEDGTARFIFECVHNNGYYANVLVSAGAVIPDTEKLTNEIASKLLGVTVYGPAVVIFTRKLDLKI